MTNEKSDEKEIQARQIETRIYRIARELRIAEEITRTNLLRTAMTLAGEYETLTGVRFDVQEAISRMGSTLAYQH